MLAALRTVSVPCGLAALLLSATAATIHAQEPAERPAPLFTMAAGEHDLVSLVDLLAQVRKARIHSDRNELEGFADATVHLQRELRVDGDAFENVATALLQEHGFIIVPEEDGTYRVRTFGELHELEGAAIERTPQEIFGRPAKVEFITTAVPAEIAPLDWYNRLRPTLVSVNTPCRLLLGREDGKLVLTGTTQQVGFALRLIQAARGLEPAAQPPIGWREDAPLPWPGGRMPLRRFTALFADTLDANVLGPPVDIELDLGQAERLRPDQWFARATQVLHDQGNALLPADVQHRVFLLLSLRGPRSNEIFWRARFDPPDSIAENPAGMPVFTAYEMQHIRAGLAAGALRGRRIIVSVMSSEAIVLIGMRPDVVDALEAVRKADKAK